jgi:hypothetical protein
LRVKVILNHVHKPLCQAKRVLWWKRGIEDRGDEWELENPLESGQFGEAVISWGVRERYVAQQMGLARVVMECGFLGDRLDNWYVGMAGLNGMGHLPGPVIRGRGEPFHELLWPRRTGRLKHRTATILGQVPGDTNLLAFGTSEPRQVEAYGSWLRKLCPFLDSQGLEVGFRGHPKDLVYGFGLLGDERSNVHDFNGLGWTKDEVFEWSDIVVAFNSNALVEAFCFGCDVLPANPGSMCWPVRSALGRPRRIAEREKMRWLDLVASYQWSTAEIQAGDAWRYVADNL